MRTQTRLRLLCSAVAVVGAAVAASAAPPPGIPDGWSDGYVYANGIRIHYYHAVPAPGKPVIVMAHGVTDIGLCWTTLTWELEDDYDIYMVDARGHGLTDPPTAEDDRDTMTKDLVGFVQAMGFEKPILMGHSMGAGTVMRVGAQYPDLAKAIIMLDPGLGRRPPPRPEAERAERPAPPPRQQSSAPEDLNVVMRGSPEELVRQNNYSFDDLVAKARHDTPMWDIVDCQYWALSKIQYHGNYSSATRPRSGLSTEEALAKIQVPALILKADASPEARQVHQEAASVMPNGQLVHIDDSGHNLHHDQLERTVEALNEFLSTL